mgnify:CR=1 FL=1
MIKTLAKETVIFTAVVIACLLALNLFEIAFEVFLGSALACCNLLLIEKIIESSMRNSNNVAVPLLVITLKFPILYLMGYLLLTHVSAIPLLCGMSLIFGPLLKAGVYKIRFNHVSS